MARNVTGKFNVANVILPWCNERGGGVSVGLALPLPLVSCFSGTYSSNVMLFIDGPMSVVLLGSWLTGWLASPYSMRVPTAAGWLGACVHPRERVGILPPGGWGWMCPLPASSSMESVVYCTAAHRVRWCVVPTLSTMSVNVDSGHWGRQ